MTRILVIEDEASLLEEIVSMLTFEGFDALGAENGYIGIQLARKERPDLIISDIMMPGLDGYHVLMELRNDPITATIPFIFLTARVDRADLRKGMEFGADDYLTKPFTVQELLTAIRTRLEKQKVITDRYEQQISELRQAIDYAIPHEMRTPLTLMLGYSDMLVQDYAGVSPEQLLMMASSIKKAGLRLQRLIENYLLYTQLEIVGLSEERLQLLRKRLLSCRTTLVETVVEDKAKERERLADIVMNVEEGQIFISENDFKKIVEELIDNALKFSEPRTCIEVVLENTDDGYMLTIRDEGRGMTPEQLSSIGAYLQFERKQFEQQGLGLGLIVAKRLTEMYGGEFRIESQVGQGTEVSILLPH